jgi:regulation of enolase protein 1 (concanavalin A-like superfamily)
VWKIVNSQYFLEEAGASISDVTSHGATVWSLLKTQDANPVALAYLLKIMVMLDDAPPYFVAKLSQAHAEIAARGQQYRVQLPAYFEQQRAMVVAHCPLPAVLQPLVGAYAATTPEDMWADGLRVQAPLTQATANDDGRS